MKIILLCGGRGSRLRPLTDYCPKPLVPLNGKPLLTHIIEGFIQSGCQEFIICLGYKGECVRNFIVSSNFDASFTFSDLGEDASMLARMCSAIELAGDQALIAYGDTLVRIDLEAMHAHHTTGRASVTIATAKAKSPFGLLCIDKEGKVLSFEEKPVQIFYIGLMLVEKSILLDLPPNLVALPDGTGLVRLFKELTNKGKMLAFPYEGTQITFNTKRELHQAEEDIISFYTSDE